MINKNDGAVKSVPKSLLLCKKSCILCLLSARCFLSVCCPLSVRGIQMLSAVSDIDLLFVLKKPEVDTACILFKLDMV